MEKIEKKEARLQEHILKEKESEEKFDRFVEQQKYLKEMAAIMEASESIKQSNVINEANEEIKSSYKELINDIFEKLETKFIPIEKYNQLREELRKTNESNEIAKEVLDNAKKHFDEKIEIIKKENPNWHETQGHRARALGQLKLNQKLNDTQKELMKEYTNQKFKEIQDILDPKDETKKYLDIIKNDEENIEESV